MVKTDDDDDDDDSSLEFSNATSSYGSSVTRLGDLLGFGFLKPSATISLPKSPKSSLGNFYRHLAIFSGPTVWIPGRSKRAMCVFRKIHYSQCDQFSVAKCL